MKKKSNQRRPQKGKSEVHAGAQNPSPESEAPAAELKPEPERVWDTVLEYPPAEAVAEAARGEPNPRLVADYIEAITVLRDEKGFTFREIAQWLTKRFGIEADHNAVYRAYTKGMDDHAAAFAAIDDQEDEQEIERDERPD